ncbi:MULTISPECIES: family 16 glycosylhydrolase [unclassified Lentimonas]|uniref:family 16 glycosylhydrolase n=1 Tax=unclassified Lentimonas TaxID=2630993 RepID=UPI00132C44F2|nr:MULTISPECIES: family 16 glycosylhydrolase [unclassified Lentimonas]CAA6679665.1 Unannotated [Lentimonas sp. CC4]CAA7182458.1 Unannotated [Lentimonas sp. CC8]CAA6683568.1 Unannotated [Lentimonas sp. CC6]CAA7077330.1 Unannotated [Lentimonas sp. CC4]CAA7170155.1 Unannotated [Lentimonas sp. CC21]
MMQNSKFSLTTLASATTLLCVGLQLLATQTTLAKSVSSPYSDPLNKGGWQLNKAVSDEFDSSRLDEDKWLIQGRNGEYKSRWIGRAPSQFSTENVRVEDGKLKIATRWEPDFDFSDKIDKASGDKYENITTAAVIGKEEFHYGYMEIRCKAADASITSSFWMTGVKSELDVFEFVGKPSQKHKKHLEKEMMATMINWGKPQGPDRRSWRDHYPLDWRVADDFHVYGCEWNENYLKFYADGKLVGTVTKEELGERWILVEPASIWVDSETFSWVGLPFKEELPADFEIDYIRVWQ